jgi:hypothetical protein
MHKSIGLLTFVIALLPAVSRLASQTAAPAPPASATNLGSDPDGNPLRRAIRTGHVSNYDETKVGGYTLPDPLVLAGGGPVRDPGTWRNQRRAELIRLYETEIFGRVPASAPKVTWETAGTDPKAREGAAILKRLIGRIGDQPDGPRMNVNLYTPSSAKGPVPIILIVNFAGNSTGAPGTARGATGAGTDPPVASEIIARGWGYATLGYQDIQPDRANTFNQGVIGVALGPGQTSPAPDEWGSISAWAWGVSRIIDYFETDPSVDATQIALQGFSRIGKTALWAAAKDERIKVVFSACAGEMGSALSRRDFGETVDDMAQNFPWQFAGNFQKYVGRWNEMPVDAHMLIALSAPRAVFLTGGTKDQWADPKGEFLAAVAAGPVYKLLGKKDLGVTEFPAAETSITTGELGWAYHTGPHQVTPAEWRTFVEFVAKYFK